MKLALVRACTRSACFELQNNTCYTAPAPFRVQLNGQTVLEACGTNVFSVFSLEPGKTYHLEVLATDGDTGTLDFATAAESFFVDASRYGLVNDGVTDNTAFLQAALSTCPPGGTVYVPAGTYRTQSLFLCSNTTLYLEKGCTLLGGTDRREYPILPGVLPCADEQHEAYLGGWEGNPLDCFAGLINVINAENVTITGEGCINANADNGDWYQHIKVKLIAWRPRLFFTSKAKNVTLHGVEVCNSFSWTIHPTYSDGVNILQLQIHNRADSPNTDGIDPESCKNVNIIGDSIHVGDDCIALKSGKLFLGTVMHTPCENVTIRNCNLNRGHGGLVIGSEMSGGVEDVQIWDCDFANSLYGIEIKATPKRGGYVRGVTVRDCTAPRVILHSVSYNDDGEPAPEPPKFSHCWFEGLTLTGRTLDHDHIWQDAAPIEIVGFDCHGGEIEDITFKDITITKESAELKLGLCSGVNLYNVTLSKPSPSGEGVPAGPDEGRVDPGNP